MMRALKNAFRRMRLARKGVRVEGDYPKRWMNGYMIYPLGLDRNSVIYSVGVGRHISFDLALIESFGATVHAFDPTPVSIEWVRSQKLPAQFVFHDYGIAAYDGTFRFYPPRRSESAHFTSVPKTRDTDDVACVEAPVYTPGTIMKKLGHDHLDLLKLDIEGGEYEVIDNMLKESIRVRQLIVEFHHNFPTIPMARTVEAVRALRKNGYRLFHVSDRTYEMGFIRAESNV